MRTPYRAISVIMLLALTLILGVSAVRATPGEDHKEVICHPVAGEGQTKTGYSIVDVDKASSHFDDQGNPKHEAEGRVDVYSDENGLCPGQTEATPTPVPSVDETPAPSFDPCAAELAIPELTADCPDPSETPVPSPTSSIDVPATMTPTPVPTASDIPNTGLPYMVDEGNHENDFNWFAFLLIAGSMGWMIQRAVEAKKESE